MNVEVKIRTKPDRRNLQLYYIDPRTGAEATRSAGTHIRREAERAAARWEAELAERGAGQGTVSWDQFRQLYEDLYLPGKSVKTQKAASTAMNRVEQSIGKVRQLDALDSLAMSDMVAKWRKEGLSPTSIATYLGAIRAALGWAERKGWLRKVPAVDMPVIRGRFARSRPITLAECRLLLKTTRRVITDQTDRQRKTIQYDWRELVRFQRGLWLSGLRLAEAVNLSWDSPPLMIDLTGSKFPRLVIHHAGQKSRRDQFVPLAPDFANWLERTPPERRTGPVLPIHGAHRKSLIIGSSARIGRILSDIGRAAGIQVNEEGKCASAHDFRRAFGTRWARHVKPLTLMRMMRHKSIATTLKYYVDQDVDEVAEELWALDLYPHLYRNRASG